VVNDQADGDGRVFVPEKPDGLESAVIVDFKIVLPKASDSMTRAVAHCCLQDHQVNLNRYTEIFLVFTLAGRRNLGDGQSAAEDKKKDREHDRFRNPMLSV